MIIKQLLPKSLKTPEISSYLCNGLNYESIKSYLAILPVADRIFGMEHFIAKDKIESFFITESHKTELPIQKTETKLILKEFGEANCFFLQSNKSSVFPFYMGLDSMNFLSIPEALKYGELVVAQVICSKRHSKFYQDKLWTQYEDFINGIESPTNNKIIRSIQHKIIEIQKKLEGGYRLNPRIDETEKKLTEDMFQVEVRFMVFGGNRETRRKIANAVHYEFKKMDYINSWEMSEYERDAYFVDMQLRRPSFFHPDQILCISELVGLLNSGIQTEMKQEIAQVENSEIEPIVTVDESDIDATNPFSYLPRGIKKKREPDIHIAQKINQALKKLSLISNEEVVIQKIQNGATVQKITFNLPTGLTFKNILSAKDNIQAELALSDISFEQGSLAGTVSLNIVQDEREQVMLRDCVESESFKMFLKDAILPVLLGVNSDGDSIFFCLTKMKHLLFAGTTGSGKSVSLNVLLTVLLATVSPASLQVYLVDPKMVELKPFASYPHVQKVFTDMDEAEGLLCYLCEQMDKRYAILETKGYKNIQQYNRNEKEQLTYKLLVVDELSDLMSTNPEVEEYLIRLAQKARAAGIHIILATQYPIKEVLTPLIKRNIISRICFALDSGVAYRVVLDEVPKFTLLGRGDGIYRLEGIQGIHRFQGALIGSTEEEQDMTIARLSSFWKESIKKEVIDIESARRKKKEAELNNFKRIVLETNETRVSVLQDTLKVRTEKVKELMDELINLNWVKQHTSRRKGYELLLNDEQKKNELSNLPKL